MQKISPDNVLTISDIRNYLRQHDGWQPLDDEQECNRWRFLNRPLHVVLREDKVKGLVYEIAMDEERLTNDVLLDICQVSDQSLQKMDAWVREAILDLEVQASDLVRLCYFALFASLLAAGLAIARILEATL